MPTASNSTNKKVVKAVRDAIVTSAEEARVFKEKTSNFAVKMQKKWKKSKSGKHAADGFKKATAHVVDFGRSVAQGVSEGMARVNTQSKKK